MPILPAQPTLLPADILALSKAPGIQYRLDGPDGPLAEVNTGFADVVEQKPVTGATVFNGYSITKTFTAIAVLQLVEQGKIALTDTVGDYLPEYRFSEKFTVEQLLSHRAGFANPLPLAWAHLAGEHPTFDFAAFSHRIIAANARLKSEPGKKMRYSNVGYLVLGELIERVSGMSYEAYVRKHIFEKIQTRGYLDFNHPKTAEMATGYYKRRSFSGLLLGFLIDKKKFTRAATANWTAFNPHYVNGKPYGGIVADATGLADYLRAILNHKLFENPATADLIFSRREPGMGLGWFAGQRNGEWYFSHAGGGGGFYCEIRVYPDSGVSSVFMTNRSGFTDERLLDKMDGLTLRVD